MQWQYCWWRRWTLPHKTSQCRGLTDSWKREELELHSKETASSKRDVQRKNRCTLPYLSIYVWWDLIIIKLTGFQSGAKPRSLDCGHGQQPQGAQWRKGDAGKYSGPRVILPVTGYSDSRGGKKSSTNVEAQNQTNKAQEELMNQSNLLQYLQ